MRREDAVEVVLDLEPTEDTFREDVLRGLSMSPKRIPSLYLYDRKGSHLFDRICELDEYYPTRTETDIMHANVSDMADRIGPNCLLIEFGSGSGIKTRILLDALDEPAGYVPIEVSRDHLIASSEELSQRYPTLEILPVCADFMRPLEVPEPPRATGRRVVYFPGSTIGNFEPSGAQRCLSQIADVCGRGGSLLIGADLEKDTSILQDAYDDAEGVTAEFNLNLLRRINRELDGDFNLDAFAHRAVFNKEKSRMEMHLVSLREQVVRIADVTIAFAEGETIHTESSHKYTLDGFQRMAADAGLKRDGVWTDAQRLFSVQYFVAA